MENLNFIYPNGNIIIWFECILWLAHKVYNLIVIVADILIASEE
jgi:hypothetical protein